MDVDFICFYKIIAIIYHQTDTDGNWAGKRPSPDYSWNIDLVGDIKYGSINFAPYQVVHYNNGQYQLREISWLSNDFSVEEINFIKDYVNYEMESIVISIFPYYY